MPYALTALPDQHNKLLVGLRGGTLLLSDDAAESWLPLTLELDVSETAIGHNQPRGCEPLVRDPPGRQRTSPCTIDSSTNLREEEKT